MFKKLIIPTLLAIAFSGNASALTGTGKFKKKANHIQGTWYLVKVEGKQVIAFSDRFKTKTGSDLKILLSKQAIGSLEKNPTFIEPIALAKLKELSGEQHYVLPERIDITEYESILIYSEESNLLWGGFDIPKVDFFDKQQATQEDDLSRLLDSNEGAVKFGQ